MSEEDCVGLRRLLKLTCEESTQLVSQSLDVRLPPLERVAVRLHALYCSGCRNYRRQLLMIRQLVREMSDPGATEAPAQAASLSPEARVRITGALRRAAENDIPS